MTWIDTEKPTQWIHPVGQNAGETCAVEEGYVESVPGRGRCNDHDRIIQRVEVPTEASLVEILHNRDSDGGCEHAVFVGGVRVENFHLTVIDVDPGRGYTKSDWLENIEWVRNNANLTPAFRELAVANLEECTDNKYIEED